MFLSCPPVPVACRIQNPEGARGQWTQSVALAVLSGHRAEPGSEGGRGSYERCDPNHVDSLRNQTKQNELKQTNRPAAPSLPASEFGVNDLKCKPPHLIDNSSFALAWGSDFGSGTLQAAWGSWAWRMGAGGVVSRGSTLKLPSS